jgi:mRNA interferase RelE/StbE
VRLLIERQAARRLAEVPEKQRVSMIDRLKAIARDPFAPHANVKPMRGEQNLYRLRQGKWRAVYRVDRRKHEVRVVVVETRERAYR